MKEIITILCFVVLFSTTIVAQKKVSSTCSLVKKEDMDYCINNSDQPIPPEAQQLLAKLMVAQKYTGSINRYILCNKVTSFVSVIDNEGNNCLLYPNTSIFKKLSDPNTQEFIDFCHAIAHFKLDGNKTEREFRQEGFDLETVLSKMLTAPPPSPVSNSSTPSLLGIWEAIDKTDTYIWSIEQGAKFKTFTRHNTEKEGIFSYDGTWDNYQDFLTTKIAGKETTYKFVWKDNNTFTIKGIAQNTGLERTYRRSNMPFPTNLLGTWEYKTSNCNYFLDMDKATFGESNCDAKFKDVKFNDGSKKYYLNDNIITLNASIYELKWDDHDHFTLTTINNGNQSERGMKRQFSRSFHPIEMVLAEGGTFNMGCTSEQEKCDSDEKPTHQVTLSNFYIGKYEVTQQQWQAIMGTNPSYFKNCLDCPVENVSWNDVQDFLSKLNQKYPPSGGRGGYRLPTEAEWEYAARERGKAVLFGNGKNIADTYQINFKNEVKNVKLKKDGQYDISFDIVGPYRKATTSVGTFQPNSLGLYDMAGNVDEWCSDWKGDYSSSSQTNPTGVSSGSFRVNRGGSWSSNPRDCRVAVRGSASPDHRSSYLGFRVALSQ